METKINGHSNKRACKIRKRGCSSSSSSSIVRKDRFKRAILAGKTAGGSSTPVKTLTGKFPISVTSSPERISPQDHHKIPVSARKLAATLWEINSIATGDCFRNKKEMTNREKTERSAQNLLPDVSDRSFSPVSEKTVKSRAERICRTSVISQKLQLIEYNPIGLDDSENIVSAIGIEPYASAMKTHSSGHRVGIKSRLQDVSNNLRTSRQLINLLIHPEGNQRTCTPLISALQSELASARSQINHLIKDHQSNNNQIECLIKCFAEEKRAWKQREREKIRGATAKFSREIESERKIRKQTERMNKKLAKELDEAKYLLLKLAKESDGEKRAKEVLGQVCDELARGVGENKVEVEKLRRENERLKHEIEKEREMMQIADVLREQRVQMKLSYAKYEFEEKNSVVEKLKTEFEAYLRSKIGHDDENESQVNEYESDEDDLRSIDLNGDSNNRSFRWSIVVGEEFCETTGKTRWEEQLEIERDKSIKALRDYILMNLKIPSDQRD